MARWLPLSRLGDLVLLRDQLVSKACIAIAAKLAPRFQGPFCILKVYKKVNTIFQHVELGCKRRAHVGQLKKFCGEAMYFNWQGCLLFLLFSVRNHLKISI